MKKWKNNFYEYDYNTSQIRKCEVILEEINNPKHGLYEAIVVDIIPIEEFHNAYVVGGIRYPYKIGEKFLLRQHKTHRFFKEPLWQDVRYPGRDGYEDFSEIKDDDE